MRTDNEQRALQFAAAFSESTGFGAAVLRPDGEIAGGFGDCVGSCPLCEIANADRGNCSRSHIYGMGEAERFGGKYIYFCALGLTCFTAPILLNGGDMMMITVGPCLMVSREDYIDCEVTEMGLPEAVRAPFLNALNGVRQVSPGRVQALSTLLFVGAGFLGSASRLNHMLDRQSSGEIQGRISAYIHENKQLDRAPYPIGTEKALLAAMSRRDRGVAQNLLNELLGHILLTAGADINTIVSRVNELLVLMSRTAMENGADVTEILERSHGYINALKSIADADALCFFLAGVMNRMMESIFQFPQSGHAALIRKAMEYIDGHLHEKLTLPAVAAHVFLTPTYFGRVFKNDTGMSFSDYINRARVEKSKSYLADDSLRLTDIAQLVGFEDQSYFTKVFKRVTGVTPDKYRKRLNKATVFAY